MSVNYKKSVDKLNNLLITKDLGEYLTEEVNKYIAILNSDKVSEEDKHYTNIMAEDLISSTRDFPELVNSSSKGRK